MTTHVCVGEVQLGAAVAPLFVPNTTPDTAVRLQVERIDSSPLNPRTHFDEQALQALARSLGADGLLQPIIVTPASDRYVIVAGERRWRAAKLLGWTKISAIVRHDVDDATHIRLALLENLARTDLDPLEEAEGLPSAARPGHDATGDRRSRASVTTSDRQRHPSTEGAAAGPGSPGRARDLAQPRAGAPALRGLPRRAGKDRAGRG